MATGKVPSLFNPSTLCLDGPPRPNPRMETLRDLTPGTALVLNLGGPPSMSLARALVAAHMARRAWPAPGVAHLTAAETALGGATAAAPN
jgi:hypothetical protein